MVNRVSVINHQIPFDRLNLTCTTYKIKCKEKNGDIHFIELSWFESILKISKLFTV